MSLKLKKMYAAFSASAAGGDGSGNGSIKYSYNEVDEALKQLNSLIADTVAALNTNIPVTSYQGSAQEEVQGAVNAAVSRLKPIEQPLTKMQAKIAEVKTGYESAEASLKSSLADIATENFNA